MHREFPVSNAGIKDAFDYISQAITTSGLGETIAHRLCVILDEVCSNMIRHDPSLSDADRFSCDVTLTETTAILTVSDTGAAFDPITYVVEKAPDLGGHGIALMKGLATDVRYARVEGRNRLVVEIDARK